MTIATSAREWSGCPGSRPEADIRIVSRLLFAAYFLEAGFILVFAPWSGFWDHNRFTEGSPAFESFIESPYVRGGVTGIGAVTAVAGLAELASVFATRARRRAARGEGDLPPEGGSHAI